MILKAEAKDLFKKGRIERQACGVQIYIEIFIDCWELVGRTPSGPPNNPTTEYVYIWCLPNEVPSHGSKQGLIDGEKYTNVCNLSSKKIEKHITGIVI